MTARQFKCRQCNQAAFHKQIYKEEPEKGETTKIYANLYTLHCSKPQLPALGPKRFVFHGNTTVAYNLQVNGSRFDVRPARSDFQMCYDSKVEAKVGDK